MQETDNYQQEEEPYIHKIVYLTFIILLVLLLALSILCIYFTCVNINKHKENKRFPNNFLYSKQYVDECRKMTGHHKTSFCNESRVNTDATFTDCENSPDDEILSLDATENNTHNPNFVSKRRWSE